RALPGVEERVDRKDGDAFQLCRAAVRGAVVRRRGADAGDGVAHHEVVAVRRPARQGEDDLHEVEVIVVVRVELLDGALYGVDRQVRAIEIEDARRGPRGVVDLPNRRRRHAVVDDVDE